MLVIADSSPLIALVNIGHIEVLPKLFAEIVIPPAVASEIAAPPKARNRPRLCCRTPRMLKVQTPKALQHIPELHQGEIEKCSQVWRSSFHADLALDRRAKGIPRGHRPQPQCRRHRSHSRTSPPPRRLLDLKDSFQRFEADRLLDIATSFLMRTPVASQKQQGQARRDAFDSPGANRKRKRSFSILTFIICHSGTFTTPLPPA